MDGQAEAMPRVRGFAAAARRAGARLEQRVGAERLLVDGGRAVGVLRSDGEREAGDVVIVAAGTWSAGLLAPHGVRLPFVTRALQMLLTEPGPGALAPVLSAFERKLSFKQLSTGVYLIGGGWPAGIPDEAGNPWGGPGASLKASLAGPCQSDP